MHHSIHYLQMYTAIYWCWMNSMSAMTLPIVYNHRLQYVLDLGMRRAISQIKMIRNAVSDRCVALVHNAIDISIYFSQWSIWLLQSCNWNRVYLRFAIKFLTIYRCNPVWWDRKYSELYEYTCNLITVRASVDGNKKLIFPSNFASWRQAQLIN